MNQSIGTFEFIDLNYVVAGAKLRLNIRDYTIDDFYLKDLANKGLTRLRSLATMVPAVAQLQISDYKTKLPEGFIRFTKKNPIVYVNVDGKVISGIDGQEVNYIVGDGISGDNIYSPVGDDGGFYKNSPYDQNGLLGGTCQVVNGYIYFSTNIVADFVKIAYLSANVDRTTGELMIPAYCEDALVAFICWNYCRTNFDKYGNLWQSYENEWKNGKKHVKAIASLPSSLDYEVINCKMLTLS